jgi:Na+/melibiose symporter-like transporter
LNSSTIIEECKKTEGSNPKEEQKLKVTFKMFLTNRRAVMASISSIFAMIFMIFYDTIYSNYLLSAGIPKEYIGYFFALGCAVYSIFSPIVGYICKFVPKLYLTQFSFVMAFISLIMFGPSEVLGFPQSLTLMILGNILNGFAISFIFVPLPAEIIDAVKDKEGITENNE